MPPSWKPLLVLVSAVLLPGCSTTFQPTVALPEVVAHAQFNADGSVVPWGHAAKSLDVLIEAQVSDHGPGPNGCPTTVLLDAEIWRAGIGGPTNVPNGPVFPAQSCASNPCAVTFPAARIPNLAPSTAYRWQARATTIYYWLDGPPLRCDRESTRNVGYWVEYGFPGGLAFQTPAEWNSFAGSPSEFHAFLGRVVAGSFADLQAQDGRSLRVESLAGSDDVSATFFIPAGPANIYHSHGVSISIAPAKPCDLTIWMVNPRSGANERLHAARVSPGPVRLSGLSLQRDPLSTYLTKSAGGRDGFMIEVTCRALSASAQTIDFDFVQLRYEYR
jgi:hypothetical protein